MMKEFPELNYPQGKIKIIPKFTKIPFLSIIMGIVIILMVVAIVVLIFGSYGWIKANLEEDEHLVTIIAAYIPFLIASFTALGTLITWILSYQQKRKDSLKESLSFEQSYDFDYLDSNFPALKINIKSEPNTTFNILTYVKIVVPASTMSTRNDEHYIFARYTPKLDDSQTILIKPQDLFLEILNLGYTGWSTLQDIQVGHLFNNNAGKTFHIQAGQTTPREIILKTPLEFFDINIVTLVKNLQPWNI